MNFFLTTFNLSKFFFGSSRSLGAIQIIRNTFLALPQVTFGDTGADPTSHVLFEWPLKSDHHSEDLLVIESMKLIQKNIAITTIRT